jgi:hypothetical protein
MPVHLFLFISQMPALLSNNYIPSAPEICPTNVDSGVDSVGYRAEKIRFREVWKQTMRPRSSLVTRLVWPGVGIRRWVW